MKPSKNRFYCKDSGKVKMLFDTERRAQTFIKFNGEEIKSETGVAPERSYYCISCDGWHVTSKTPMFGRKSVTEIFLDRYRQDRSILAQKKAELLANRLANAPKLRAYLTTIDEQIIILEDLIKSGSKRRCIETLTEAFGILSLSEAIAGQPKAKRDFGAKLNMLKAKIDVME